MLQGTGNIETIWGQIRSDDQSLYILEYCAIIF